MRYDAVQFMQNDLVETSRCCVFVGNNRWLRRTIREKIAVIFGQPKTIRFEDESSLRYIADIISQKPLIGSNKTFVYLSDADPDTLYKWLDIIRITPTGIFLLIDFNDKKADKRIFQSQLKALAKYNKSELISSIDVQDPPEDVCRTIIALILSLKSIDDHKIADQFLRNYGSDFELSEENSSKLNNKSHLDKREASIKDVWAFVDNWIYNKLDKSLVILDSIESSAINPYACHGQISRQFRQYIIASETGRGHYTIVQGCKFRSKDWLVKAYNKIVELNPMRITYFESMKHCLLSTFIDRF